MTAKEPSDRLSAEMILNHPWITRNFNSFIPMTCTENLQAFSNQKAFLLVLTKNFLYCKLIENIDNKICLFSDILSTKLPEISENYNTNNRRKRKYSIAHRT